jgi:hypothetical protein
MQIAGLHNYIRRFVFVRNITLTDQAAGMENLHLSDDDRFEGVTTQVCVP